MNKALAFFACIAVLLLEGGFVSLGMWLGLIIFCVFHIRLAYHFFFTDWFKAPE